jgi:hypothetical protein
MSIAWTAVCRAGKDLTKEIEMPRYLMTYFPDDHSPPTAEKMGAIAAFGMEQAKAGKLLESGGFLGISRGADVKLKTGKFSVLDGPFPETKELIVGYAIVKAKDRADAIEQARQFMAVAGDGSAEIRQMVNPQDEGHH